MGQADVIHVLEKSSVPMSTNQIAKALKDNCENISKVLRVLLFHKEIKCVELNRYQTAKIMGWNQPIRRTRFYYIEIKSKEIKEWQY